MTRHPALLALALAPLAACFDPVEPEVEPADLRSGLWDVHLTNFEARGDCATIAVVGGGSTDVVAFFEVDDDEVLIEMEGLWLDGDIDGSSLSAHGGMAWSHGYEGDDVPPSTGGGGHSGDPGEEVEARPASDCVDEPESDGSGGAPPPCMEEEPYEPSGESLSVELDSTILAEDLIRGQIFLDWSADGMTCRMSADLVGLALDDGDWGDPEPLPYDEPVEPREDDDWTDEDGDPEDEPGDDDGE